MTDNFTTEELQEIKKLLLKEKFKHLYRTSFRKEPSFIVSYEGHNMAIIYDLMITSNKISFAFMFYRVLDPAPDNVYKKVRKDFEKLLFRGFEYRHTHENVITIEMENIDELRRLLNILKTKVYKAVSSLDGMYNRGRGRF